MEDSEARTPPQVTDFPETGVNSLASFGQRFGGWLIDVMITIVPATLAAMPFVDVDQVVETGESPAWVLALGIGVWILYQVALVASWGKTVGCLAVGVRIARYVDGKTPAVDQAALRALVPAVFPVIPIPILNGGWVVVYLSALYNPLRRGIHDLAGGTVVIRTR